MGKPQTALISHALRWVVAGIALAMSVAVSAQDRDTRLAGQIDLARLVDVSASRLGVDIQYEESQLRQQVTLRLTEGLTNEELWALTNRLLAANGFTTVQVAGTNLLSVVRVGDAPGLARIDAEPLAGQGVTHRPGFEAAILRATHLPPQELLEALRPAISKSAQITLLGRGGLVLIQDFAPRLDQTIELAGRIDVPGEAAQIERIQPAYLSASRLASGISQAVTVRDLVAGRPLTGKLLPLEGSTTLLLVAPRAELDAWRSLIEAVDRPEPIERREYRPRQFGLNEVASLLRELFGDHDGQIGIVNDPLTGSLLVRATPTQHERIAEFMKRLDAVDGPSSRSMRTFAVRNRPVEEVASLLENLLSSGLAVTSAAEPAGEVPGSQQAPLPRPRQESGHQVGILLTADPGTSSIIATGEPRLLDELERLLRIIDKRQPQVMLEVTIVALSQSESLDFGVELEKIEMGGNTLYRLASLFGLSSASGGARTVGDASGLTGVILNPGDFSVVVRALETVNKGRSISSPRVLVNNNGQATLDAITEQPFLSVNASDTVATTSFGGSSRAGTQVTLRPQIAEGDHLILEYDISLSSFVGDSSDPALPPPRQDSSLSSVATIPDGYAIVLGGLEISQEGDAENRIPILGRIPVLGNLFKNQSRSQGKTKFYVVIRASVMRGEKFEALKYLSRRMTDEFGIDDGWPVVVPRLIQ